MTKKKAKKPTSLPEGLGVFNQMVQEAVKAIELMEPEVKYCEGCRVELARLKWNTKADILICNNDRCGKWHQPQGYIEIEQEVRDGGRN